MYMSILFIIMAYFCVISKLTELKKIHVGWVDESKNHDITSRIHFGHLHLHEIYYGGMIA